jgi:adenosine deaminase
MPYKQVVAQAALAFALAQEDPKIVGVNFVAPEDDPATLRTYARQMHLVATLHDPARPVHVSLHAGELTLGLVPRADLRDHIASAVEVAGAERIGHGVDIGYEDDAPRLLQKMADAHILVEIGLSSNDLILGVRGADHPLPAYLAAHVPVALITDDEGVSRIDLTNEFVRAERDYGLDYATIKTMVRNSLEYAFAPGASLWIDRDYTRPVAACAELSDTPPAPCAELLRANLKMRLQYGLERELRAFEAAEDAAG